MSDAREGEPVAEGELRHVFVATARGETIAIPERIRSGLARYAAEEGSEERPRP